jgi:hypothetical protein
MVAEPACNRIVTLSRSRWDMLTAFKDVVRGDYHTVLEPMEYQCLNGTIVVFLPATYVCEDGDDTNAGAATR